jgi:dTDP-4-amino-4,6-dideoxygalactose transaminase
MINVTKSYLPPLEEYIDHLKGIWQRVHLTNGGPLVMELEDQLRQYFQNPNFLFMGNGTIAIQIAIKALELKGEILTTPFSYVATTTSILWENCTPVFVDIEPETLTINADLIESFITNSTTAILATHVYGVPCDVEKIKKIAEKHHLKIIYDAAHSFGVKYKGTHLVNFGDVSTLSFHATKLFHTVEGGAILSNDSELLKKMYLYRSFGHTGNDYYSIGINGKNSEIHAAMGLCILPKIEYLIEKRKNISALYDDELFKNNLIIKPVIRENTEYNFAYYPVIFHSEKALLKVCEALNKENIFPRRYFYPSLNELPYLQNQNACKVSEDISLRVLCLPIYDSLSDQEVQMISEIILRALQQ